MIRTESSGGWQNRDCSIALPYVCKKKPNATAERPPPGERGGGGGVSPGSRGHSHSRPSPAAQGDSDPPSYLTAQLESEQIGMCS